MEEAIESRSVRGLVSVRLGLFGTERTGRGCSHDQGNGLVILNRSSESHLGLPEEGIDGTTGCTSCRHCDDMKRGILIYGVVEEDWWWKVLILETSTRTSEALKPG